MQRGTALRVHTLTGGQRLLIALLTSVLCITTAFAFEGTGTGRLEQKYKVKGCGTAEGEVVIQLLHLALFAVHGRAGDNRS